VHVYLKSCSGKSIQSIFSKETGQKEKEMNLNELAREIAKREGKKISLSIAQIKEVIKIIGEIFLENDMTFRIMVKNCRKRRRK
jgi:hypothetical protein